MSQGSGALPVTEDGEYAAGQGLRSVPWSGAPARTSAPQPSPQTAKLLMAFSNLNIATPVVATTAVRTATVTADRVALFGAAAADVAVVANFNATVNLSGAVGANGPDKAGLNQANGDITHRFLALWAIYNSGTQQHATLASDSSTDPVMPLGYDYKRRVGWLRFRYFGESTYPPPIQHMVQSGATTIAPASFASGSDSLIIDNGNAGGITPVSAVGRVPPTTRMILGIGRLTRVLAGVASAQIWGPFNTYDLCHFQAAEINGTHDFQALVPCDAALDVRYSVNNPDTKLSVLAVGWFDNL